MYEQISFSLLNEILIKLQPDLKKEELQHFYTRLGANFYTIFSLFKRLYGERDDFREQALSLVETMAKQYPVLFTTPPPIVDRTVATITSHTSLSGNCHRLNSGQAAFSG